MVYLFLSDRDIIIESEIVDRKLFHQLYAARVTKLVFLAKSFLISLACVLFR